MKLPRPVRKQVPSPLGEGGAKRRVRGSPFSFLVLSLLLATFPVAAFPTPQVDGNVVRGTVVNSSTGDPIADAQITLMGGPVDVQLIQPTLNRVTQTLETLIVPSGGATVSTDIQLALNGRGTPRRATTDRMGRFSIPDVPQGLYRIRVRRDRYVGPTPNGTSAYVVVNGRQALNLTLRMIPFSTVPALSADTLPPQLSDAAFWSMTTDFSEPGGSFQFENFLSNEDSYQDVIPALKQTVPPGGAYLGVGPEQNFTYIAALQPKVAFIVDIRRQNLLELLMYKALFEMSSDRADFVSRLFSRKRPAGLTVGATADALFRAFGPVKPDAQLFDRNLKSIKDRLIQTHGFPLSAEDQKGIDYVYQALFEGGTDIDYNFRIAKPSSNFKHSYAALMTATDGQGVNWSYLAKESSFQFVREMERKNLIVPLVGDFAGPKAIKAVGQYLTEHDATLTAFYVSNVEEYIRPVAKYSQFWSSVSSLPVISGSSFIRWSSGTAPRTVMNSMTDFLEAGRQHPITLEDALQMQR